MHPRVNILGVGISAVNLTSALEEIERWIEQGKRHYVCVTPVHGIMACHWEPDLRAIFNASGLTTPDGMPIVWLLRWLGHRQVARVYGPDLMLAVCQRSLSKGYRHFLFGGEHGVAEALKARLQERFPGLQVVGTLSPPFGRLEPEEDEEMVRRINEVRPDIVWVGLGCPKQERWMAEHRDRLKAPVLIGVGAAFDFLTGRKPQAPRWMQRAGLEWLFRLLTEPRRLWGRYLINNPLFVALVVLQALRVRRYSLE